MKQVRLGVIGCGVIGPQHMEAAKEIEHTVVSAVCDKDAERARQAAEKFGVGRVHTDPLALMDDPEVDAVILALPTGYRTGLAIESLRRGKHVMIEKPVAMNEAELRVIMAESEKHPDLVVAGCSARYQFLPHTKVVTEFIATGALGDLRVIHFRGILPPGPPPASPPPAWRVSRSQNGGGILVNWGIYELDYMLGITGWKLKPRHVLANWWTIPPQFEHYVAPGSDGDSHFASFIMCEGGTVISFERAERAAAKSETVVRIVGTKGSLTLSMFPEDKKRIIFHNSSSDKGVWDEVIWERDEGWGPTRTGIVDDFARAVLDGRPAQTDLARSLVLQKITDAIYLSGDEKRPVEITGL